MFLVLPIIPSKSSHNFYPLFLFIPMQPPIISVIYFKIFVAMTMEI